MKKRIIFALALCAACDGSISDSGRPVIVTGNNTGNVTSTAAVFIDPSTVGLSVGATAQLGPRAVDSAGSPISGSVTWSTSNAAVVSVDANGVITGRGTGTAIVTATVNGRSGNAVVTVT